MKIVKLAATFLKVAQYVERKRTRMTGVPLAKAMYDGFVKAFGRAPSLEELASGFSQAMHEQGGNFYNYNFGNITASKPYRDKGGMHTLFTNIREYSGTGKQLNIKKNYFRAYPTAEAGAADFWKLIGNKYKKSFGYMQSGNPIYAALALSDEYYYTGNRFVYAQNMGWFYKNFMEKIAPQMGSKFPELAAIKSNPKPPPEGPPPEFKAHRKTKPVPPDKLPKKLQKVMTYYKEKEAEQTPAAVPMSPVPVDDNTQNQVTSLESILWS